MEELKYSSKLPVNRTEEALLSFVKRLRGKTVLKLSRYCSKNYANKLKKNERKK